jgi:DNA-binding response OmpR family regulator
MSLPNHCGGLMNLTESRRELNRHSFRPTGTGLRPACIVMLQSQSHFIRLTLDNLEQEGFDARTLLIGADVISRLEQLLPALVIVEASESKEPALELCREIRRVPSLAQTPMILVAASASEEECILGLESGADDFVTESSGGPEFVARVRAVIRRSERQELYSSMPYALPEFVHWLGTPGPTIRIGDIEIDPAAMRVSVRGSEVLTTHLEFRLLYYLVHNQSRVFSRGQLLDAVWGTQYVELRCVDACVRRLRHKIEPDPLRPTYLRTVRGAGYRLVTGA